MNAVIVALALWLAHAPPASDGVPEPPSVASDREATRRLIVQSGGLDFAKVRDELAARWPDAEIHEYGADAFAAIGDRSFAYVEVIGEGFGDAPISLTVVMSDGRAYVRSIAPSDNQRARSLALGLANLLGAIHDEDVPPDRTDVAVPIVPPEPLPDPDPEPEPPPDPDPDPPPIEPEPEPEPKPRPAPVRREPTSWQIGARSLLLVAMGLGPSGRRSRVAGGGTLGVDARHRNGLVIGAELRLLGQGALDHGLLRSRIRPAVGFFGRGRRIEYGATIGPVLEPWRLFSNGRGQTLSSSEGSGWTILYGAALTAAVGWFTPLPTTRPSWLRLGAELDVAASVGGSGKAALIRHPVRGELFGLGGVELGVGVGATWWFEISRRVRPASERRDDPSARPAAAER